MDIMCGKRLLVVEDDTDFRDFLAEVLSDAGFDVVEAEDGDRAAKILEDIGRLDVLVTDIEMPGRLNGNSFASLARHQYPDLTVVYVSGRPESLTNLIGPSDTFIEKPFHSTRMIFEINRLLHNADLRVC
jgi:DNA-binding response OmpR family regulator